MALAQSQVWWGPRSHMVSCAVSGFWIDGTYTKNGEVFRCPRSGTISKIHFQIGSITSSQTIRVALQDVNASFQPDDTDDQYRDVASPATGWNVTGLVTSDGTDGGTKRTVTAGEWLAVVLKWAGTAGNIAWVGTYDIALTRDTNRRSYFTSWSDYRSTATNVMLEFDDGEIVPIPQVVPVSAEGWLNENIADYQVGNRLVAPFACRLMGIKWYGGHNGSGKEWRVYDDANALVGSETALPNYASRIDNYETSYFDTPVELTAGETYRVVHYQSGTQGLQGWFAEVPAAAYWDRVHGGPRQSDMLQTSRTGTGSWTDTATRRFLAYYLLDRTDFIPAASPGGGGAPSVRGVRGRIGA